MRVSGIIFSLYLFALAIIPCCSFDECPDDKQQTTAGTDDKHAEGDGDCGNCSPFFSCEGCASASTIVQPIAFEMEELTDRPAYTHFVQGDLPHVHFDFWQPPQLG